MQHFSAGLPPEVYFGGMRIARRDPNGTVYYFLADRLGNARVLTDSSGSVVEESDYYPYGLERVVTGSGALNNYKYTGHERDTKSGLDHTLHRQLSSAQARWLSPDRARGKVINPQSWNRYSYGGNNPCNNVDPDGAQSREAPLPPDFTKFTLESWDIFSGDFVDPLFISANPFEQYRPECDVSDSTNAKIYNFLDKNIVAAKRLSAESGINLFFILALSGLESGWASDRSMGTALLNNNYFGLTVGNGWMNNGWNGDIDCTTLGHDTSARFACFDPQDSFYRSGYALIFAEGRISKNYGPTVLGVQNAGGSIREMAAALARAGFNTEYDPIRYGDLVGLRNDQIDERWDCPGWKGIFERQP